MALIVETGQAGVDSETYNSVATADEYFTKRNVLDWVALPVEAKEAALRKASDYILQTYRQRWAGLRTTADQALDYPRTYVERDPSNDTSLLDRSLPSTSQIYYPENFIPKELLYAEAELAYLSLTEDLLISSERLTTKEKVGDLEVTYDRSAQDRRRFPAVDGFLKPFLKSLGKGFIIRG